VADDELPKGYTGIPEEDQKKANVFFDRGKSVADGGQYEYAIEMYLQGLSIDPENTDAHQALRDISLKRKVSGGKDLGMFEKMKLKAGMAKGKDDKANLLTAEKLLAYDPGNVGAMLALAEAAHTAGFYDTVLWIGPILQKANTEDRKPDFNTFMKLKNIYKDLQQWKLAVEACQAAAMLRPDDMDLTTELKNLGAQHTMTSGKYASGKSFRESIRDMDKQSKLLDADKDVRSADMLQRAVADAEAEYNAEPTEVGKVNKYVDALVRTEKEPYEERAVEVLEEAYGRTQQFRFRATIGRIRMIQMNRKERSMRADLQRNPADEELKAEYKAFLREKAEKELEEFRLAADAYPTDMSYRYNMAVRLFQLERYSDAIPVFQQSRQDPKYRGDAAIALGRSFLESGFTDEAIDTLHDVIENYELKGDAKSRDMYYWYGRSLETKGDTQAALKAYSQVFQWDANYRDVQARIRRLRSGGGGTQS
jgi:tetratricopeptide (TPR) repeat protein